MKNSAMECKTIYYLKPHTYIQEIAKFIPKPHTYIQEIARDILKILKFTS